jgi:hypothetical protein
MESQAVQPSVEPSPDLSGFDRKLSTILNDFFQEKRIPIDSQQLLVQELRRAYIFSAAEFNNYLGHDLAGAKDRFGVFVFHFNKHAEGNAGNKFGIYFLLFSLQQLTRKCLQNFRLH